MTYTRPYLGHGITKFCRLEIVATFLFKGKVGIVGFVFGSHLRRDNHHGGLIFLLQTINHFYLSFEGTVVQTFVGWKMLLHFYANLKMGIVDSVFGSHLRRDNHHGGLIFLLQTINHFYLSSEGNSWISHNLLWSEI